MLPKIALVGRPNVGKSTLFNRLIRSNRAITHDRPGVTRDRMEGVVRGRGKRHFGLIDTGGITLDEHAVVAEGPDGIRGFEEDILRQAKDGMAESVAVCLVVDGRDGLLPFDDHLAAYLRRTGKPVLVVVNKVDGMEKEELLTADFHILGFPIVAVSLSMAITCAILKKNCVTFCLIVMNMKTIRQKKAKTMMMTVMTKAKKFMMAKRQP